MQCDLVEYATAGVLVAAQVVGIPLAVLADAQSVEPRFGPSTATQSSRFRAIASKATWRSHRLYLHLRSGHGRLLVHLRLEVLVHLLHRDRETRVA